MNSRLSKEFAPLAKNPAGAHGQRALVSCQFPGRLPFFSLKGSLDCLLYPCPLCHSPQRVQNQTSSGCTSPSRKTHFSVTVRIRTNGKQNVLQFIREQKSISNNFIRISITYSEQLYYN